jgi:hypothetical protein
MFPTAFAQRVIKKYTSTGDVVLDPFSGRGTAVFAAAALDRHGIGIEINPVGYVYTRAKLRPARRGAVERRIAELAANAWRFRKAAQELPTFFKRCYAPVIREFLLTARSWLDWRQSQIDCTVMALLLVHLHGKRIDSFSNQMRQTKAMSPPYAIRWWDERGFEPPDLDPVGFMAKKLRWRYAKGRPRLPQNRVFLGDSVCRLGHVTRSLCSLGVENVRLLLTSPPYCGVTNYHYDQWLRLWLLGGPPTPTAPVGPRQGKFVDRAAYADMLQSTFTAAAKLLAPDAIVYVRTDSRKTTLRATIEALNVAFPSKKMRKYKKPFPDRTQTNLFGGESGEGGEVDLVLT